MEKKLPDVIKDLKEKYPRIEVSEQTITLSAEDLLPVMQELKENYGFNYLSNLTAADYPAEKKGKGDDNEAEDNGEMEVIYNLTSINENCFLTVKTRVSRKEPELPSVFPVWGGANWQEREVYDLFGIVFTGHPNLKRILLTDNFEGYPLRKDYQWVGGRK
jgi:NADH-quinone oxidoreductase subunit C